MKRRSFIAAVGAFLAAPLSTLKARPTFAPVTLPLRVVSDRCTGGWSTIEVWLMNANGDWELISSRILDRRTEEEKEIHFALADGSGSYEALPEPVILDPISCVTRTLPSD